MNKQGCRFIRPPIKGACAQALLIDEEKRFDMLRATTAAVLRPFNYLEIDQARDILGDSQEASLSEREILKLWGRISDCLDHHATPQSPLPELRALENELAEVATFKKLQCSHEQTAGTH